MAARRRRDRAKLKLLVRAGLVSQKNASRTSVKRIDALWDSWGALIANPDARPFHMYTPRSKAGRRAMRELAPSGVSTRGLKSVPIPIIAGVKSARVRVKQNELRIYYTGGIVREQIRITLDPRAVATGKGLEKVLARVEEIRKNAADISVSIRTGPGVYSPLAHGETPEQAIRKLKRAYPNWRKWMQAIEVLVVEE